MGQTDLSGAWLEAEAAVYRQTLSHAGTQPAATQAAHRPIAMAVEPRHRPWAFCLREEETHQQTQGQPMTFHAHVASFSISAVPQGPSHLRPTYRDARARWIQGDRLTG